MKEEFTKQTKYVCPNNCGNFAMLNRGVSLALCQRPECDNAMMISISKRMIKKPKEREQAPLPFICERCGEGRDEGIHSLAKVSKRFLCYKCTKDFNPVSRWTSHSKSSNE